MRRDYCGRGCAEVDAATGTEEGAAKGTEGGAGEVHGWHTLAAAQRIQLL